MTEKNSNSHIHEGHRERMKEKFLSDGADAFLPHELLEIMLYYCVPRRDTNPLAHKLINTFGSFSSVFDAPPELLIEAGLSKNAAVLIHLIPHISRIYLQDRNNDDRKISKDTVEKIVLPHFVGRKNEVVLLVLIDAKGKVLYSNIINEGSVGASEIYVRDLVNLSVKYNASAAMLAHNHPSGVAVPSRQDLLTTKKIAKALRLVNVTLLDHIVVADNEYTSMAQSDDFYNSLFVPNPLD